MSRPKKHTVSDIPSLTAPATGFKLVRAQVEKQESPPCYKNYRQLTTQKTGWLSSEEGYYKPTGHFEQCLEAVQSVKQELPHTRKRMNRQTYKTHLLTR